MLPQAVPNREVRPFSGRVPAGATKLALTEPVLLGAVTPVGVGPLDGWGEPLPPPQALSTNAVNHTASTTAMGAT